LFNNEKFWDCHEELEDHWLQAGSELEKYLYWVVIQVATIVYHYRGSNLAGAQGLLAKSKNKVEKIKSLTNDVDELDKLIDWNILTDTLNKINKGDTLEKFSALSDFKFKKFYEEL
jgi:hypothetical protein